MKTAVIVLTYNRPLALLAVLRALTPQCQADDEIWIADDGSRQGDVEVLRQSLEHARQTVRHVWHPDVGFTAARARNMAAARTQADYLIFLDGDCLPHATWLQQHKSLARLGSFVNGSRVLLSHDLSQSIESGAVDANAWGLAQWARARLKGDCNKLAHLLQWPQMPGRDVSSFRWKGIRSCNFGLWRSDYVRVNGFDERFSGWGHEDADLVLRLHNLGLTRRNGHWATEVFHLWHRENDRGRELANRTLLEGRLHEGLVRAELGLDSDDQHHDVVVSRWGSTQ